MSNERDELALILVNAQRARYSLPPRTTTEHCSEGCWAEADAILAAGYRKSRTITTREELASLPDGSVIGDSAGDVSERRGGLWCSYETAPMDDSRMGKYLPATVLHDPETKP